MGCLIDPVEGKAEIELRDSNMGKRSNENQNPLKEKVFIVGDKLTSLITAAKEATPPHPRHFGLSAQQQQQQ